MLPYEMIAGGTFSLTTANIASGLDLECQSQNPPDFILLKSLTGWGEASDAQAIEWWWERSMAQGTAKGILQSSEGSTPQLPAMTSYTISSAGISTYDTANPPTFAGLATTAITGIAGSFIVTMANTGSIAVGDYVRLYGTTGELQIAGYSFQVTAVTANTSITLGYMASSGTTFAADASAGTVVKFIPNRMYPRWKYIANITQAAQGVVYFTEKNDYTPGEIVSFRVSSAFGMEEINNVQARVLSVTNSATVSSITLDLDTSGFTAFSFPTSAVAAAGVSPAVCVPSSSGVVPLNGSATIPQQPPGTNLLDTFDNRNTRVIHLGTGLFNVSSHASDNGDVWMWQAFKYSNYQSF
jgi:hypothetical protein